MKYLLFLLTAGTLLAQQDVLTIYEVDGVNQINRVTTFGRAFRMGEIAACPQPVIAGVALDTSHYQVDVRNRWPDGSLKFAVVSLLHSLAAGGRNIVSFRNTANCNNTGYLDVAGMLAFHNGNWGATMEVSANHATRIVDAKAMLQALSIADCQVEYSLRGPLVTEVRVQDCTPATAFDFGAHWDGTAMAMNGSDWYSGNSHYASLHPVWVLRFVPSASSVRVEYGLENSWASDRVQDQVYALVLKAGSPLATVYTSAGKPYADANGVFVHHSSGNWRKTFWSGPAPSHVRIDHNFAYLISTRMLPYFDPRVSVDPSSDYQAYAAGDRGDINGAALLTTDWAANSEGASVQRHDLEYLYNMTSCGAVNSLCAKAWALLTGEVDSHPSNTLVGVAGGGGMYAALVNANTHLRESSFLTGHFYHCPNLEPTDAVPQTTCGGTVPAFGRPLSVDSASPWVRPVGSVQYWWHADTTHWLDYTFVHYLLTGEISVMSEAQFAGAWMERGSPGNIYWGPGPWFFSNPAGGELRGWIWPVQQLGRAALVSPDGSIEQTHFTARVRSNLAVMEGMLNVTGTTLTPSSRHPDCSSYNPVTANRWDWGRCTYGQNLANPMHSPVTGYPSISDFIDTTKACMMAPPYHRWWGVIGLSALYDAGFAEAGPARDEIGRGLIEQVLDPTYNPYLIAVWEAPLRNGPGCVQDATNQFLSSYTAIKAALLDPAVQNATSFYVPGSTLGFPCADHGYSLVARAAGSYLTHVTSGSYTGANAWSWLNANVPYFSRGCPGDSQIKFALAPRPELFVNPRRLPAGLIGAAYAQQPVATGGEAPYTWTVINGSVPNGLALSSSGSLTGVPSGPPGNSAFTVQVTDSAGAVGVALIELQIYEPIQIPVTALPPAFAGLTYRVRLVFSGGDAGQVWTLTSGSLPAGLALSADGEIAGVPQAAGPSSFTATVTDAIGNSVSKPLSILVQVGGPPADSVSAGRQIRSSFVVR